MPLLCTMGAILALMDPVQPTRAPDCGGILTPLGLSYRKYAALSLQWGGRGLSCQSVGQDTDTAVHEVDCFQPSSDNSGV